MTFLLRLWAIADWRERVGERRQRMGGRVLQPITGVPHLGEKNDPSSSSSLSHSTLNWSTSDSLENLLKLLLKILTTYPLHIVKDSAKWPSLSCKCLAGEPVQAPQSCSSDLQFYLTIFDSLSTPCVKALELPLANSQKEHHSVRDGLRVLSWLRKKKRRKLGLPSTPFIESPPLRPTSFRLIP